MTVVRDPDRIAMVTMVTSAIVASRDAALRLSIRRAVGSHVRLPAMSGSPSLHTIRPCQSTQ